MFHEVPNLPDVPKITLHPGEYHASASPVVISTLLGSCVAACLYDPVSGVAGMNHFLLANRRYSQTMPTSITEAGRYGVHAMELLINQMIHLGADRRRIRAKAFGAGIVLNTISHDSFLCVGEVNERFIREFCRNENIRVEAEDLGGDRGRFIRFRTDTFPVYRRFIVKHATNAVEQRERRFWEKAIEQRKDEGKETYLFS